MESMIVGWRRLDYRGPDDWSGMQGWAGVVASSLLVLVAGEKAKCKRSGQMIDPMAQSNQRNDPSPHFNRHGPLHEGNM